MHQVKIFLCSDLDHLTADVNAFLMELHENKYEVINIAYTLGATEDSEWSEVIIHYKV